MIKTENAHLIVLVTCVLGCIVAAFAGALFGRGYFYITSVVIVILALIPFFVSYETSRPSARSICVIAVMCALSIASRLLFAWLPHFKPTAGMVMISGIALGPRSGFLIGALTMLLSNFLFGQGYWTPWQMLSFGIAGLVFGLMGGVFKNRGCLTKKQLAISAVAAALLMIVVAGPILDTSSAMMFLSTMTPEGLLAIYLAGLPVNAIQGIASAITMLLLANPILGKLSRVKTKYGI